MNDLEMTEIEEIAAQLAEANQRLNGLVGELRAVDGELNGIADERQRYELLRDACDALDQLSELGAGELFWGERPAGAGGDEHVRGVRQRMEGFLGRLEQIESRREDLLGRIREEQEVVEILEEDLFQAQEDEERRKLEWIVEREISALPSRKERMAWTRGGEDDERFRKSLGVALLVSVMLGLLLPLIDLPLPERWETIEVPERLARLVEEKRAVPPPSLIEEPVVQEREPEPEPEPEPIEEPLTPTDQPVMANDPTPKSTPRKAEQPKPQSKGILAFREKFANIPSTKSSPKLGAQAKIGNAGDKAAGRPERAMVTSQAPGSSGGINLASLSRDVGGGGAGGQIAGVQLTQAASTIGGGGGQDRPLSSGAGAGRTDEEIQIVFDRHKAALYRLYNRELRKNPTLQGQMVLRIRIEPDGSVSMCELQSTDMAAPDLSAQVLGRVRSFDFGAKEVPPVTIVYPIDFLPAA